MVSSRLNYSQAILRVVKWCRSMGIGSHHRDHFDIVELVNYTAGVLACNWRWKYLEEDRFVEVLFKRVRLTNWREWKKYAPNPLDKACLLEDAAPRGIYHTDKGLELVDVRDETQFLLGLLPYQHRNLLEEHYIEGKSVPQIAKEMECTPTHVYQLLQNARTEARRRSVDRKMVGLV